MKISIAQLGLLCFFLLFSCNKKDSQIVKDTEGDLIDIDGNMYKTIEIEGQVWMAENLKVSKYSDGTPIQLITDEATWSGLEDNNLDDAYSYYNNNMNGESDVYGALYTWAAAMNKSNSTTSNPSNIQGVCPVGWHLPSSNEWGSLISNIGGPEVAGGKLKEVGNEYWWEPNIGATDEFGFAARPGGLRDAWGVSSFYNMGGIAFWWSATETTFSDSLAISMPISNSTILLYSEDLRKSYGISVRCVKD